MRLEGVIGCKSSFVFERYFSLVFLFVLMAYSCPVLAISCNSENILLSSQAAIDNFQADYGPCDRVAGNIRIDGSDVTNVDGLSAISHIEGNFVINNNDVLQSLAGLSNLTDVGGDLFIAEGLLTNLDGLSSLNSVGRTLVIYSLFDLVDVNGLSALTTVGDDFILGLGIDQKVLSGLNSVTSIGGTLSVYGPSLVVLGGFSSLTSISGVLDIQETPSLIRIDGFPVLTDVGGITLHSLDSLISLNGFRRLKSVYGNVLIASNASLPSLNGLGQLIAVGHHLIIDGNPSLADCRGIIRLVDQIDNGAAGPGPGIAGIPDIGGSATFENAPGCNSADEILASTPGKPDHDIEIPTLGTVAVFILISAMLFAGLRQSSKITKF